MKINVTLAIDVDVEIDVDDECIPNKLKTELKNDVVENLQEDYECILKPLLKQEKETIEKLEKAGIKYSLSDLRPYEYWTE